MSFVSNPRRDASPAIAGFVLQVNITILRWLALTEGEHLELECGEDIDTVQSDTDDGTPVEKRLLEQIKARSSRSITLRSKEALESLANFCGHRAAHPGIPLRFRYLTTASTGMEQGWDRPEGAIETWMALRRGRFDDAARREAIGALRDLLKSCSRPTHTSENAWKALQQSLACDDDSLLGEMIFPFEWATGGGDYAQTERDILASLSREGYAKTATTEQVYEHLLAFVFRLLCKPGRKLLTIEQLAKELETPSIAPADRGILLLIRDELSDMKQEVGAVKNAMAQQLREMSVLKQTVGTLGRGLGFDPVFALSAASLSTDPPESVNPCARRDLFVDSLLARIQHSGVVALIGEPGSGKTQILLLVSEKSGRKRFWLNIPRDATEAQAGILLDALVRSAGNDLHQLSFRESCNQAAEHFRNSIVVIEDLPRVVPGGQLAARIDTLARTLKRVDACLFLSSYFRLPATMKASLGDIHCDAPRFADDDVAELLMASNAPLQLRNGKTANLLVLVAEGLPTLVMAAVRYLMSRDWNFTTTELESLFRGEFAAAHRKDASSLLQVIVPDVTERELLIRMSLAIGDFSMEDIAKVALVPKAIPLPGEKVQRATGVWLQEIGNGRYSRSPLITSALADALDPKTRLGVHFVLALRILARKAISPIEVFTCVNHLMMANAMPFAVTVVIQLLATFIETDGAIEDDFGFARMWTTGSLPDEVDLDLQLYLRSMQIVVLAKQGHDITAMIDTMDAMIARAPEGSWGAALAAGTLAIHLVWLSPIIANKYLLESLGRYSAARMPDGSSLPTGDYPLEVMLWMSGYTSRSDAEVDSWLATIARFTPAQIATLRSSELMEDNVTILCDGIWRREYDKPEQEWSWSRVRNKLEEVEATARAVSFPLLEAAAIRTKIMVLAEWQHQVDDAVALSESSLQRFDAADCRFLILEVTGRQLSYAGRQEAAIPWLLQALECDAYRNSLWRRDVLITLAKLEGAKHRDRAVELTKEAVRVSERPQQYDVIVIEALAEHGIAEWKAGNRLASFNVFEQAVNKLLESHADTENWKGLFYRLFAALTYFSSVAQKDKPQEGQTEPEQGSFLANREVHTFYREEQQSYICIRMGMFADGVRDINRAAAWTWRAIDYARQIPTAWTGVRLLGYLAMSASLLANDFSRAAELAVVMSEATAEEIIANTKAIVTSTAADPVTKAAEFDAMAAAVTPRASKQAQAALQLRPFVPMAVRLAHLQLLGTTPENIVAFLAEVEAGIPEQSRPQHFMTGLRRALLEDATWEVLQEEGFEAVRNDELVRGYTLCLGAMLKAPVPASLHLQTMLAQHFAPFAITCPSVYRELIAPFFRAYWEKTIDQSVGVFRTALVYSRRQMQLADGSPDGTRKLLAAMRFCLGVKFPDQTMAWLEAA